MRILIADDDLVTRRMLEVVLGRWGYEVVSASDGARAWELLRADDPPQLAILDWMMPEMNGLDVCRKVRESRGSDAIYLILLTIKGRKEDIVAGLEAGANDYILKPFHHEELRARVQAGRRIVELQSELAVRVQELQEALTEVKTLSGMLPICSSCKKIRDDRGYWNQIEAYIREHSEAEFTHSICPECTERLYGHLYEQPPDKAKKR